MEKLMELNKETANRLWVQQFGKKQKAYDFSGREIAKAAYNDRNSDYAWNVDHILPQSRGGKTVDHNLICCHVLTNDEKADKFPCFVSNGKTFEIFKKQNHYEIGSKSSVAQETENNDKYVNFLDSAQGLAYWEACDKAKPIQHSNQSVLLGYVKIYMNIYRQDSSYSSNTFIKKYKRFLNELFSTNDIFTHAEAENIYYPGGGSNRICYCYCYDSGLQYYSDSLVLLVDINDSYQIKSLLNDCITLNTYNGYFVGKKHAHKLSIVCGVKKCQSKLFELKNILQDIFTKSSDPIGVSGFFGEERSGNFLSIDEYVKNNTDAAATYKTVFNNEITKKNDFYAYDIIWKSLKSNLDKNI